MHGQTVVINDLLSFLTCKIEYVPKDKLLSSISEYYPENVISEAHKTLLSSLPLKKSTRHGRKVKHPDTLTAIYECIELVPKEDMPVFVCKNLNDVPQLNQENKVGRKKSCLKLKAEFEDDKFGLKKDENFYRKEQKQMRSQIAEMFSIISELTEGLQKLTDTHRTYIRNSDKILNVERDHTIIYQNDQIDLQQNMASKSKNDMDNLEDISTYEEEPDLDGMALIQKFIDEDDKKSKYDMGEKDDDPLFFYGDPECMEDNEELLLPFDEKLQNIKGVSLNNVENCEMHKFGVGKKELVLSNGNKEHYVDSMTLIPQIKEEIIAQSPYPHSANESNDESALTDTTLLDRLDLEGKNATEELRGTGKKEENAFECHYCLEMFTAYKKLRKHMICHCVMKNSYRCVLCHGKFVSRDELRDHFQNCFEKHKEEYKDNICFICKTYYASDKALKQHKNLHEEFRPHPCPHCPFKYLNKARLDAHVKNQHSPLKTLVCPFCPHSAITNTYLTKHMKVHTGEAPFLCKTCGHRSKTKFQLKRHMELHGPLRERKCDKCNFVCIGLNQYLRHRRKQHGKPIVCQICKQSFKQSDAFVRHFTLHTKNKPYKCDLCLYRATVKETLRLHKLTHSGSCAELCPKCGVPCRNKRNLTRHLLVYCNAIEKQKSVDERI